MKSFKSTWLFAILVIGFSFYVYMFEFRAGQKEEAKQAVAEKVFPFEQEEIEEIEIKSRIFDRTIQLKKMGERWQLLAPKQDLVDEAEILALTSTLSSEKAETVIEDGEVNKKEFGLESPLGEIFVRGNGKIESILVGAETSYDGKGYVMPSGKSTVRVVDSGVTDILSREPDSLRDKVVLRARLANIKMVEYRWRNRTQFVLRDADGVWKLNGHSTRLDTAEVKVFLGNLEDLRVDKFVIDKPNERAFKKFGLEQPEHQFVIVNGEKTLKVGISREREKKAFLSTTEQPPIMSLPWSRAERILIHPDDLKDKGAPFDFELEQVDQIQISKVNEKIEIERDGESWKLKNPIEGKFLNRERVKSFLGRLKGLKAEKFLASDRSDLLKETTNRVVLNGKEGVSVLELAWGKEFREKSGSSELELVKVKTTRSQEPVGVLVSAFKPILQPKLLEAKKKEKD